MSMDQNSSDQNLAQGPAVAQLCRSGCGFFGSPSFDGWCSKCHNEAIKRRQQNPAAVQTSLSAGRVSPVISSPSQVDTVLESNSSATVTSKIMASNPLDTSLAPNVETATPTVAVPSTSSAAHENKDKFEDEDSNSGVASPSVSNASDDSPADKDKKPKKNRCHTCKKKVGLTGFQCRCGGLYCSMHRYSDKHDCSFDYKELAQQQIRKANPVIVGEKIQKI